MASVKKFARNAVPNLLRHNERTSRNPSNRDIDPARSHLNYSLIDRDQPALDYYKQRMSEVKCYNRADVKTLCSWVMTAPQDLKEKDRRSFFESSYRFVAERYGEENMVQAIVHRDESGEDHMHVMFIPVTRDREHGEERICSSKVVTRADLRSFHRQWEQRLRDDGIDARVRTGITAQQGGNRSVQELKKERERQRAQKMREYEAQLKTRQTAQRGLAWEDYVTRARELTAQKQDFDYQREKERDRD